MARSRKKPLTPSEALLRKRIALNLHRLLYQRGWRLDDFGRASGVARSVLTEIKAGRADARLSTLRKIAGALGMKTAELIAQLIPDELPRGPSPVPPRSPRRQSGLALLSPEHRQEIARLGGQAVAQNPEHMAEIGRLGGQSVASRPGWMSRIGKQGRSKQR